MCLGIPGKVVETFEEQGVLMGKIKFGGIYKNACLEYVSEAKCGDYVVVHVGFALSRIDESEAKRIFTFLHEMDDLLDLGAHHEVY